MDEWNYLLKIFADLKKEDDFEDKKQTLEDILQEMDKDNTEKESERKKYITVSDVLKDLEKDKDKEIDEEEICDTIDILHSDDIETPELNSLPTKYDIYDYESLIFYLKKLGGGFWETDFVKKQITYLISRAIIQKAKFLTDDTIYQVSVDKQIVAIAFNFFIDDAEKTIGEILDLNPNLFYTVSGPFSTVVLLDTRRWVLESKFSLKGEEDTIWHI